MNTVTIADIPFSGDFVMVYHSRIVYDSRIDGGDVPPLLAMMPITWVSIEDGMFRFEVSEELNLKGE